MTWTYDEIERDWLGGSRVATLPEEVVTAFIRCERMLGREWVNTAKRGAKGSAPTLSVVTVGQQLASLEDIAESRSLIEKLHRGDNSAFAELRAIHLLRSNARTRVELEPAVSAGGRIRKCDFRIRRQGEPWVYVEVTQPDTSDARRRVQSLLDSVVNVAHDVKKPFALEVFLRREPTDAEIPLLIASILEFCSADQLDPTAALQEIAGDMGTLFLSQHPVGQVVIDDHGERSVPRLGAARAIVGPGEPNRHVAIRVPFADSRAEQFLTTEARQLPTECPALIMVEMGRAPGGFRSWEPLLRRRFQPNLHTRVGGVCLFSSGLVPTDQGETSLFEATLIVNTHAKMPLPRWVETTCAAAHEIFLAATGRAA